MTENGFLGKRLPMGASWRPSALGSAIAMALALLTPDIALAQERPYRLDRWIHAKVTAYCAGACCCGAHADGKTATGRDARLPGAAAAPAALPYGSVIWIHGAGYRVIDDTGGAMRQSWRRGVVHVDLRCTSHAAARRWGVRWIYVALYARVRQPAPTRLARAPADALAARLRGPVRSR